MPGAFVTVTKCCYVCAGSGRVSEPPDVDAMSSAAGMERQDDDG